MHLPLTMKEYFFNDSPKLSIWMLVGYQGHFKYTLEPKGQVFTITIGTPIAFGSFGQFWPNNLAQFWPNLAHFVTGVGSSNLTVVNTFRNVV